MFQILFSRFTCIICVSVLVGFRGLAQSSFYEQIVTADPVADSLPLQERLQRHRAYLLDARAAGDSLRVFYAHMYLISDQMAAADYQSAMRTVLQGERLADSQNEAAWRGKLLTEKGFIRLQLDDYRGAVADFEAAVQQSGLGRDTHNVAMALEQLGAAHAFLENYAIAHAYYERAFPLLTQHAGPRERLTALLNYGNLLSYEDRSTEAIAAYQTAMTATGAADHPAHVTMCRSNIASEYLKLGDHHRAIPLLLESISQSEQAGWTGMRMVDYHSLADAYAAAGNHEAALQYERKYQLLQDSIKGGSVQRQVAKLETAEELEQKTEALSWMEHLLEVGMWRTILLGVVGFVAVLALTIWLQRLLKWKKKAEQKSRATRQRLIALTKQLAEQRPTTAPPTSSRALSNHPDETPAPAPAMLNPYSFHILTVADWETFKQSFENSNPHLIQRLRHTHASLTEAEERLFLLLRLQLTTVEIANVIGVKASSVKKTRTRLRKKLHLSREHSLETFIQSF